MKEQIYSKNQLESINKQLNSEKEFYKQALQEIYESPIPNALKSAEAIAQEEAAKFDNTIQMMQKDAADAIKFYIATCPSDKEDLLGKIFGKIGGILNAYAQIDQVHDLTYEDCKFLEELAKVQLIKENYEEASCMYRFIIKAYFSYSEAWVGWAVCEEEQGHTEVVDIIYQLASEVLPNDYYICLFAVDHYISTNQKQIAVSLLEKAKAQIVLDAVESPALEEIEKYLKDLKD